MTQVYCKNDSGVRINLLLTIFRDFSVIFGAISALFACFRPEITQFVEFFTSEALIIPHFWNLELHDRELTLIFHHDLSFFNMNWR